jgi:hypothetical protein
MMPHIQPGIGASIIESLVYTEDSRIKQRRESEKTNPFTVPATVRSASWQRSVPGSVRSDGRIP